MIIETFNLVHLVVLFLPIAASIGLYFLLRKKTMKTKEFTLIGIDIFNAVFFIIYKFWLSRDADFEFNIWTELPLQLCNINIILFVVAILTKSKTIRGFCFFTGPLGAYLALVSPEPPFLGMSVFALRNIGFYGTHMIIVIVGISFVTLGLYQPRVKMIPRVVAMVTGLSVVIYLINLLLRATKLAPEANYFFTMGQKGNMILELFRGWIDVDFLYLLPAIGIITVWMLIIALPYTYVKNKQERRIELNDSLLAGGTEQISESPTA